MIQRMPEIWSLVPLPFLKPAWTSGSSGIKCYSRLSWKIWGIPLLACATAAAAAAAKSHQLCLTLCNPKASSLPGSPVPGILQARTLEWVAISFSNAWKWSRSVVSDSSQPHGLQPTRLLRPRDFPGNSTGVGCHCLLRSFGVEITKLFTPNIKFKIGRGETWFRMFLLTLMICDSKIPNMFNVKPSN